MGHIGLGQVNLPCPAFHRRRQVLGLVHLPPGTTTALVAADALSLAHRAADQGTVLAQNDLDLVISFRLQGEDALAQAALVLGHAREK